MKSEEIIAAHSPEDLLWTEGHDDGQFAPHWWPHVIKKRTDRFVYVVRDISHIDYESTVRLDRAALESEGSVWCRQYFSGDRFYTTAAKERARLDRLAKDAEQRRLSGIRDLKVGREQMELGSKLDFVEVGPGVLKAVAFNVFAHDGREESCEHCGGTGKVGRLKCGQCSGKGVRDAVWNYLERNGLTGGNYTTTTATDLERVREMVAGGSLPRSGLAVVWVGNLDD